MIIDKEFHSLIPPLTPEEYKQLEENILADGIRESLITWQGILIDGHNRYAIAQEHGIEYRTVEKEFTDRSAVIEWMVLNQFGRRNLSNYQRSLLALKLKPVFEEKAKEKQREAGGTVPQKSAKPPIETRNEIAKLAGVSHDTIAKVQKIEAQATPEVKAKIATGEVSINQAYQSVQRAAKVAMVERKIEMQKEKPAGIVDIYNTTNKYNIVYADPAWRYFESGNKNQSLHYQTMTIEDICALPIRDITDENCVLFLWVTFPILQECFKVIESWGFSYSTCGFNWIKQNKSGSGNFFGCGSWTRANSELCLIATKGSIIRLDATVSQIVETPIEEHSRKPAIVRELITRLVGKLPRIELFCRTPKDGWDSWGNEL